MCSSKKKTPPIEQRGFLADRGWKVDTNATSTRHQAIGSMGFGDRRFPPRLATATNPTRAEMLMSASIHCMRNNAMGQASFPAPLGLENRSKFYLWLGTL